MKITVYSWTREGYESCEAIYIDGKEHAVICPPEPEDCILGRDLPGADVRLSWLEMGFTAAKKGETYEVEFIESAPPGW